MDLLREYVRQKSEEAFAALVARHVNMVYSAALRKTGNPHAAEEITQVVFILLAKKAAGLQKGTILSGWLYQAARLTSASFLRTECRRVRREQEACMESFTHGTESEVWPDIAPMLEDAMGKLNEKERSAIALRFFEGRSFHEIGTGVGASENAAKKRVSHGLERLRAYFFRRGVTSTTAIIAGAISTHSIRPAPAALAGTVTAVAIEKGVAAGISTLTLLHGASKFMAWTNAKMAIAAGAAVLLAAGTGTIATKAVHGARAAHDAAVQSRVQTLQQENALLNQQVGRLQSERDVATNRLAVANEENLRLKSSPAQAEVLKLRGRVGVLRSQLAASGAKTWNPSALSNELHNARLKLGQLRDSQDDQNPAVQEQLAALASLERSATTAGETLELAKARAELPRLRVSHGDGHPEVQGQLRVVASLEQSAAADEPPELAEAKAELARLRVHYGDAHSAVQSQLQKVAGLQR